MEYLDATRSWLEDNPLAANSTALLTLVVVALIADFIVRHVLLRVIRGVVQRTGTDWDDVLLQHKVFGRLIHILPAAIIYFGIALIPGISPGLQTVIRNVAVAYVIVMLTLVAVGALSAADEIYRRHPAAKQRPIKGYVQVAQIILYLIGAILVIATLMERSPLLLLSGFGAMTAVLLLVFRDTILGLVASVQIASNDMLRVGDWVEMPKYGADGDVIEIALHTVKIRNWDKTITSVPTHQFIADSFKNWRGMSEIGGRRIKRALHIDTSSVRFLSNEETAHFREFNLLRDYIREKEAEVRAYNEQFPEPGGNVNARRLTNIGTFRAYVLNYLKNHPLIRKDLTLIVRQLPPGPNGLPLEIYAFSADTRWPVYEGLQADIFDHLIAITPQFGLRVFQTPSGADFRSLGALDAVDPNSNAYSELVTREDVS